MNTLTSAELLRTGSLAETVVWQRATRLADVLMHDTGYIHPL
ncbi:hypothetical protein S7335_5369 [Synechococcus sp. PCC 7335]|nr:hypothetical protein S7335_5369 [Synechococcus sp. PCC 7335]